MTYQELMHALNMIWDEKPRLDIRASRDEAYNLLDPALQDLSEYTWACINEMLEEGVLSQVSEEQVDEFEEAINDAMSFGVDLYLACALASAGRLTATGRSQVDTEEVLKIVEDPELQLSILEKYELVPLLLRDFAFDRLDNLTEFVPDLLEVSWAEVNEVRQNLLALATTSFLVAAIHLGDNQSDQTK